MPTQSIRRFRKQIRLLGAPSSQAREEVRWDIDSRYKEGTPFPCSLLCQTVNLSNQGNCGIVVHCLYPPLQTTSDGHGPTVSITASHGKTYLE